MSVALRTLYTLEEVGRSFRWQMKAFRQERRKTNQKQYKQQSLLLKDMATPEATPRVRDYKCAKGGVTELLLGCRFANALANANARRLG